MLDLDRTYRTRNGRRVVNLMRVSHNSVGAAVTFPIKGSIVTSEKPRRYRYAIWTDEGRYSVLGEHNADLLADTGASPGASDGPKLNASPSREPATIS